MEANIYYGEERYQRMMVKATEESGNASPEVNNKPKAPANEYEDLQDGNHWD